MTVAVVAIAMSLASLAANAFAMRARRRQTRNLDAMEREIKQIEDALGAMKPNREFTKLHLLSDAQKPREAHSHAEKGPR